jgi:hypothetical protein
MTGAEGAAVPSTRIVGSVGERDDGSLSRHLQDAIRSAPRVVIRPIVLVSNALRVHQRLEVAGPGSTP